jgi:hypothetical protein
VFYPLSDTKNGVFPYVELQKQSGTLTGALASSATDHSSVVPMLLGGIIFALGFSGLIWLLTKFYQRKQIEKRQIVNAVLFED